MGIGFMVGAPSRVGEVAAVRRALEPYKTVVELKPPARMDGGDILRIEDKYFIGLSERTNRPAVSELAGLVSVEGFEVIPVPLK
jgi:dimethylargininase